MPVGENVPEPLKTALENMESAVQSMKRSLAFAAPELHDEKWAELQNNLAAEMSLLFEKMGEQG